MTKNHLPHLSPLVPNAYAAVGFNGRGVAVATKLGQIVSQYLSGVSEKDLDFPLTALQPFFFHSCYRLGVTSALLKAEFMDWLKI